MKLINEKDIESIKTGDMAPLKAIFNANYLFCVNGLKKIFRCPEDDAKDLTMDAILVLREKIMEDTYVNLNLQSFLLAVASNKWRNKQKRDFKLIQFDPEIMEQYLRNEEQTEQGEYLQHKINVVQQTIDSLGDPCKSILHLNVIQGLSLDTVYDVLDYKSKAALKTTKTRCLKKLRQAIKDL